MPRPSGDSERRLLDSGRALLPETGFSGLKVREVARGAGVNLGLFHYHFKTKERFLRRLLQENYEAFFARLSLESSKPGTPEERLGRALTVFGRFVRDHRAFIMVLLREALAGHPTMLAFAKDNVPRHARVIAGLILEGQREGALRRLPLPTAMSFVMGSVAVPSAVLEVLKRSGTRNPLGLQFSELENVLISDAAIDLRVEMVLAGLRAAPHIRRKDR